MSLSDSDIYNLERTISELRGDISRLQDGLADAKREVEELRGRVYDLEEVTKINLS